MTSEIEVIIENLLKTYSKLIDNAISIRNEIADDIGDNLLNEEDERLEEQLEEIEYQNYLEKENNENYYADMIEESKRHKEEVEANKSNEERELEAEIEKLFDGNDDIELSPMNKKIFNFLNEELIKLQPTQTEYEEVDPIIRAWELVEENPIWIKIEKNINDNLIKYINDLKINIDLLIATLDEDKQKKYIIKLKKFEKLDMDFVQKKNYINVFEFEAMFNYSQSRQQNRRNRLNDSLPYIKEGRKILYEVEEVKIWLENNNENEKKKQELREKSKKNQDNKKDL